MNTSSNRSTPTLSAVIPLYNREELIGDTIESLLKQDYGEEFEILVIDDGSTDDSCQRVLEMQSRYPNIRLIRQSNSGAAVARHRGVLEAQSDIVVFQDSDDIASSNRLRLLSDALQRHPEYGTVISLSAPTCDPKKPSPARPVSSNGVIVSALETQLRMGRPLVNGMNLATRRELAITASADRGFYKAANDYDLFLRLAAKSPFLLIDQITLLYEFQPDGISQQNGKQFGRTAAFALLAAADVIKNNDTSPECRTAFREFIDRSGPKTLIRLWKHGKNPELTKLIFRLLLSESRLPALPINLLRAWSRHSK